MKLRSKNPIKLQSELDQTRYRWKVLGVSVALVAMLIGLINLLDFKTIHEQLPSVNFTLILRANESDSNHDPLVGFEHEHLQNWIEKNTQEKTDEEGLNYWRRKDSNFHN